MADIRVVLRHLWVFHVTSSSQQFQQAAERLGIADSAVSRRISALEKELGASLFQRTPGGAKLTPAAEMFRDEVAATIGRLESAVGRLQRRAAGHAGALRIGFTELALKEGIVTRAIRAFRKELPEVEISLLPMASIEQEPAVRNGKIDVGLFHRIAAPLAELEYRLISAHRLLLAMRNDVRFAEQAAVSISNLGAEDLIGMHRVIWPQLYDDLLTKFREAGLSPRYVMEVSSSEMILRLVEAGMGMGFVHSLVRGSEPHGVLLKPIVDFAADIRLEMIWRREESSALVSQFVDTLEKSR